MAKKKVTPKTNYEIYQSIRRDWHGINPATRIQESEKIYSRQRNKEEAEELYEEYYESIED